MIQHYWTLIARRVSIDQETNNLIIGEALEDVQFTLPMESKGQFDQEIAANEFVPLPFEYEVVSFLGSDNISEKSSFYLEIELPNKHKIRMNEIEAVFGKNGRARLRFRSTGIPVSGSGTNSFRLYERAGTAERLMTEIPLLVTVKFNPSTIN